MANLNWQLRRNIESSLANFLTTQASGTTVFYKNANQSIDIRVGNAPQDDWSLPNISVYLDSKNAIRGFVGQNNRINTHLMIIEVRASDDGMRADLAEWVTDTINDGFTVYTYSPNVSNPDSPTSVKYGTASVEFVSDTAIRSAENSNLFNKFRHRITCNISIAV